METAVHKGSPAFLLAAFIGVAGWIGSASPQLHAQDSTQPDAALPETIREAAASDSTDSEKQLESLDQKAKICKGELDAAKAKLDHATQAGSEPKHVEVLKREADACLSRFDKATAELAQLIKQRPGPIFLVPVRLLPGDRLRIFVLEDPAFDGTYVVRRGGYIIVPQVGRVMVSGMPVDLAESALQKALQSSALPSATVVIRPEVVAPGDILEIGGADGPSFYGNYPVQADGTIVLEELGRVGIAGKTVGQAIAALEKAFRDSGLQRGPIRITPPHAKADQVIYLSGEFEQPHPFSIPHGKPTTLVDVIQGCGGLTEKADLTHVRVLRMMGNKGVAQEVDVKHLLDGTGIQAEIPLVAGDVIKIPSVQSQ